MSPRNSRGIREQGPPPAPDVFVGLLFVSTAALLGGIIFLVLELSKYGWQVAG